MRASCHILQPPSHGGQLRQIAERFQVPACTLLDFSASINPAGPPSSVIAALQSSLQQPATLAAYPDLELLELHTALARTVHAGLHNIVVAHGVVPLIGASLHSLAVKRCLLPVPAFGEYRRLLSLNDVEAIPFLLSARDQFRLDPDALIAALVRERCDCILFANPQNPAGALCPAQQLLPFVAQAAARGIFVLLDEAFIDYAPAETLAPHAVQARNLFVFRSVTKFFGMPGLRIAYAMMNAGNAMALKHYLDPWPVTTLAAHAVCAALADTEYAETARAFNDARRTALAAHLRELGIEVYPASANFLLLCFPSCWQPESLHARLVSEHRIVLRTCASFEGLDRNFFRAAVRTDAENARLIDALRSVSISALNG